MLGIVFIGLGSRFVSDIFVGDSCGKYQFIRFGFFGFYRFSFYSSVGQIVLGIYRGATTVAIYALAIQLKSLFTSFSTALNSVLLPKVTTLAAREGTENEISDLFIRVGRLQYFVMSFILVGFIILGRNSLYFGEEKDYVQTYYITLIIMIPFFFDLISNVGIVVLQAKDKLKYRSAPMIMDFINRFDVDFSICQLFLESMDVHVQYLSQFLCRMF